MRKFIFAFLTLCTVNIVIAYITTGFISITDFNYLDSGYETDELLNMATRDAQINIFFRRMKLISCKLNV